MNFHCKNLDSCCIQFSTECRHFSFTAITNRLCQGGCITTETEDRIGQVYRAALTETDGRTTTCLEPVEADQRQQEIARMLGGADGLQHAGTMLKRGRIVAA